MQIMFIYVDINDENLAKPFLTMFGLEEATDTVVSLHVNNNG
jgi:protein disulfide-isomerase A1